MEGDSHEDMALTMHHAWVEHVLTTPNEETSEFLDSWLGGQLEFQRIDQSVIHPWLPWTQLQRETCRIVVDDFEADATKTSTREEDFDGKIAKETQIEVVDQDFPIDGEVPLYIWELTTCKRRFIDFINMEGDNYEDKGGTRN